MQSIPLLPTGRYPVREVFVQIFSRVERVVSGVGQQNRYRLRFNLFAPVSSIAAAIFRIVECFCIVSVLAGQKGTSRGTANGRGCESIDESGSPIRHELLCLEHWIHSFEHNVLVIGNNQYDIGTFTINQFTQEWEQEQWYWYFTVHYDSNAVVE